MRHRIASVTIPRPSAGLLLAILCAAGASAPALGQPAGETTVLRAARILDGRGELLEDRDLVVRDGAHRRDRPARRRPRGPGLDTGTPDEIRAYVRDRAAAGADVIKVFASTSIRFGGVTNLSAAQLEAACGEARAQGLKAVVHLHRSDALRLAAAAGCSQVEHGWLLEPGDIEVFVESGMYLGNQVDLLFRNYEERGDRYAGVGGYTMEGFANLQAARPGALEVFRQAVATPGVRIVYSTDANAGSHGANTDELVAYVEQGGQDPMDAVVSATSLAAESLGLEDRIGAIAAGFEADVIALDGDPLADPAALGRVVFVMRAGRVYRNDPPRAAER